MDDGLSAIDRHVYFAAAREDVYGTLMRSGHREATRVMSGVLNSIIGCHISLVGVWIVGWEELSILTGKKPTVGVKIHFKAEAAMYSTTISIDARMLTPCNIPAMEVLWT